MCIWHAWPEVVEVCVSFHTGHAAVTDRALAALPPFTWPHRSRCDFAARVKRVEVGVSARDQRLSVRAMLVSQMSRSFKLSCFMLNVDGCLERAKTQGVWGGERTPNDVARLGKTCVFAGHFCAGGGLVRAVRHLCTRRCNLPTSLLLK